MCRRGPGARLSVRWWQGWGGGEDYPSLYRRELRGWNGPCDAVGVSMKNECILAAAVVTVLRHHHTVPIFETEIVQHMGSVPRFGDQ